MLVALLATVALGADICPVGCPFTRIQEAVLTTPPGGTATFVVGVGVYDGLIDVDGRDITLESEPLSSFTISADAGNVVPGQLSAVRVRNGGKLSLVRATVSTINVRALEAIGAELVLDDVLVLGLGAAAAGGAMLADGATVTAIRSQFLGSLSSTDGGHIVARDSALVLEGCDLLEGIAAARGGSIFIEERTGGVASLHLVDVRFEENRAVLEGGAVYVVGAVDVTIEGTTFVGNTAQAGGAIADALEGAATITVDGSVFEGNEAEEIGGAMALRSSTATVTGSEMRFNVADHGGAVHTGSDAGLELVNNVLCGNQAVVQGGAVWVWSVASGISWSNNRFLDNAAAMQGGAVYVLGLAPTMSFNHFLGNDGGLGGGAVWATGSLTFTNNLVGWTDGAVAVDGTLRSQLDLSFDAWHENTAGDFGIGADVVSPVVGNPELIAYLPGSACLLLQDWHGYTSPLRDAGATDLTDLDGSRADIGAYGGPLADPVLWTDADGDGVPLIYDCNDGDPAVSPLAVDTPYDGNDDDCDGRSDFDADADGFDVLSAGGSDCDDEDELSFPGATEVPYDGVDQDCDGEDLLDADGDGAIGVEAGGDDCDDADPAVHPGVVDLDPSRDLDCDGVIDVIRPLVPATCAHVGPGGWLFVALLLFARRRAVGGGPLR